VDDDEQARSSTKRLSTAPVRHLMKTPLELWLGKELPAKVLRSSATPRLGHASRSDNKVSINTSAIGTQLTAEPKDTDVNVDGILKQSKGKGKDKAWDWNKQESDAIDRGITVGSEDDETTASLGEGTIYTPASSKDSDQNSAVTPSESRDQPHTASASYADAVSRHYLAQEEEDDEFLEAERGAMLEKRKCKEKAVTYSPLLNQSHPDNWTPRVETAQQHPSATMRGNGPSLGHIDDANHLLPQVQSHALIDYQDQLERLERQNKIRLNMQRAEEQSKLLAGPGQCDAGNEQGPKTLPNASVAAQPSRAYDWTKNALYMSVKAQQAAAGFGQYASSPSSGFAHAAQKYSGEGKSSGTSFGDGSSFSKGSSLSGGAAVPVPEIPKFGVPTPLSPPPAVAAVQKFGGISFGRLEK
jgi:hypothetical protein